MDSSHSIQNYDSAFTEIFSILKRLKLNPDKSLTLDYDSDEITLLRHHLIASIETLLKGIQNVGFLLGAHLQNTKAVSQEITDIGSFIASIGNLIEALVMLGADANYSLGKHND